MESNLSEVKETMENVKWKKEDIYYLIKTEPDRIQYYENIGSKRTSGIWNKFKVIHIDSNPVEFVKCNDCIAIFQWSSHSGTSTISRHQCKIPEIKGTSHPIQAGQLKITSLLGKKVPRESIDSLNSDIVIGLAKDLRPLASVEGDGFLKIAQSLINFGAKFGMQNVGTVLQSRKTLRSKHLNETADTVKTLVQLDIQSSPSFPNLCFTFDMWTETKKNRHFLSLSCHFINDNFDLKTKVLGAEEFPSDLRKTTANIRNECKNVLARYFSSEDVLEIMEKSYAVTDGGSNVVGVFPKRLPCMCHKLNLVLEKTFAENNLNQHGDIKQTLSTVRSLVTYFKQSGLNSKLDHTLKQSVPTRWNSQITMLKSYATSSQKIQEILVEKRQIHRVSNLNETLVTALINLLSPFEEASEMLSSEKCATSDLVCRKYMDLHKHLEEKISDLDEIKVLKESFRHWFNHYFKPDMVHVVALALNPRFKSLKFVPKSEGEQAYSFIRDKLSALENLEAPSLPAAKKPKLDYEDSDDEEDDSQDELSKYLNRRSKTDTGIVDPVQFWKNAIDYPLLRKLAACILAIPASSASDERVFSVAGQLISDRRTQLSAKTVSNMIIINKNL